MNRATMSISAILKAMQGEIDYKLWEATKGRIMTSHDVNCHTLAKQLSVEGKHGRSILLLSSMVATGKLVSVWLADGVEKDKWRVVKGENKATVSENIDRWFLNIFY